MRSLPRLALPCFALPGSELNLTARHGPANETKKLSLALFALQGSLLIIQRRAFSFPTRRLGKFHPSPLCFCATVTQKIKKIPTCSSSLDTLKATVRAGTLSALNQMCYETRGLFLPPCLFPFVPHCTKTQVLPQISENAPASGMPCARHSPVLGGGRGGAPFTAMMSFLVSVLSREVRCFADHQRDRERDYEAD